MSIGTIHTSWNLKTDIFASKSYLITIALYSEILLPTNIIRKIYEKLIFSKNSWKSDFWVSVHRHHMYFVHRHFCRCPYVKKITIAAGGIKKLRGIGSPLISICIFVHIFQWIYKCIFVHVKFYILVDLEILYPSHMFP